MKKEKLIDFKKWLLTVFVELSEPTVTYSVPYQPKLKKLTEEEIDNIHSRGYITPSEALHEWKCMDLCAPGDAIGSASWRCQKFNHKCSDCLVDYANQSDEWPSIFQNMNHTIKNDFSNKVLVKNKDI